MDELEKDEIEVVQRFCPKCGAGLKKEASFCSSCGTIVGEEIEHPKVVFQRKIIFNKPRGKIIFILIIIAWIAMWIIIGMKHGCGTITIF